MPERWATHDMENNDTEKFSRCWEDSEPHVRLPGLGVWQRDWVSPGSLTLKASRIWLQDWGGQSLVLEGTHRILYVPGSGRKEQWPYRRLNLEGLLWRHGSAGAPHRDGGPGSNCPGRDPLASVPMEVTTNPIIEPVDPRPLGSRGGISGELDYIFTEQDPVFPTTGPSHQEAYTCLVASSTRGQTEEARRTTVPQRLGPEPHGRKLTMMERFHPRWRDEIKPQRATKWTVDRQPSREIT